MLADGGAITAACALMWEEALWLRLVITSWLNHVQASTCQLLRSPEHSTLQPTQPATAPSDGAPTGQSVRSSVNQSDDQRSLKSANDGCAAVPQKGALQQSASLIISAADISVSETASEPPTLKSEPNGKNPALEAAQPVDAVRKAALELGGTVVAGLRELGAALANRLKQTEWQQVRRPSPSIMPLSL